MYKKLFNRISMKDARKMRLINCFMHIQLCNLSE